MSATLHLGERRSLLGVWSTRVLGDAGVRCLLIKGEVCEQQGLREPKDSGDVDLWVDPAQMDLAEQILTAHGWRSDGEHEASFIYPLHSVTFTHDFWRMEIDVHHEFPGFLAAPDVVFEELWRRRNTATIAGHPVPAPPREAHAAIMALHALRHASRQDPHGSLASLHQHLVASEDFDPAVLTDFAARTGAATSLAPLWPTLGVADVRDVVPLDPRREEGWRIQTAITAFVSAGWLLELRRSPWRQWPAILKRALLLSEDELRSKQPDAAPGWRGLQRARLVRLGYGLRALPAALSAVRRVDAAPAPLEAAATLAPSRDDLDPTRERPVQCASIIAICTRNRPDRVERALASILETTPHRDVIVWDASDGEDTRRVCAAHGARLSVQHHVAPRVGLARQRNDLLDHLRAGGEVEIVHLIDDDLVVYDGYFDAIEAVFASDLAVAGVGGVSQERLGMRMTGLKRLFDLDGGRPGTVLPSGRPVHGQCLDSQADGDVEWLTGATMSYRLSALEGHRFDDRMHGRSLAEDLTFSYGLSRSHRLVVTPAARCLHEQIGADEGDPWLLAVERILTLQRWVRENQDAGLSLPRFWWSVAGESLLYGVYGLRSARSRGRVRGSLSAASALAMARVGRGRRLSHLWSLIGQ